MIFSLSTLFAPENLVSRDEFDSPVPRQPAHLYTQAPCMFVCMHGHHIYSRVPSMNQPGKVANPARGQLNRENEFPRPRTRLRIWPRETGSAVPSRVSPHFSILRVDLVLTLLISARRPFIYLNRHTPSGQSRVHRATQLRTDRVHCRESAGTGPVVLKVVPVTGVAILQVTMDQQLMCASLFLHPLDYWYEVGMLKVYSACVPCRQQSIVLAP